MKVFITLILICAVASAHGQGIAGKKAITLTASFANLSVGSSKSTADGVQYHKSRFTGFDIRPDFTYGKVNEKNLLLAYGLSLGINRSKTTMTNYPVSRFNSFSVGPQLLVQKFILLTDRLYFAPATRLQLLYSRSKYSDNANLLRTYSASLAIQPLSLAFNIKPRANLLLLVGNFGAGYVRQTTSDVENNLVYLHKANAFNITGTFNYFNVGYQILL